MTQLDFQQAIAAVRDVQQRFQEGKLVGLLHSHAREPALASALVAMAKLHGVTLQAPLHINSLGEFSIIAAHPDGPMLTRGCGPFGEAFAAALTKHRARTGTPGPNVIDPSNGWCYLNHFDAERMVLEYAETCQI